MAEAYDSTDSLESFEFENESENESEATGRRGRWATPSRASGRGLYKQRPSSNAVTQVQLQAAMARVGEQIKQNSAAIGTINGRLNTVSSSGKKDSDLRKKDLQAINDKIQLLSLLPLLLKPTTKSAVADVKDSAGNTVVPAGSNIVVDSGDTLTALLPLLLVGGFGSSGLASGGDGSSSGVGGMDGSTLLILALALSGGLGKK